jgi:homoserine O-acetyltransferase
MTKAMDGYDASADTNGNLEKAMSVIKCRLLIIGFDSDWLYPPQRGKDIQLAGMKANVSCTYVILPGEQGHDSFLFAADKYDGIINTFIESR